MKDTRYKVGKIHERKFAHAVKWWAKFFGLHRYDWQIEKEDLKEQDNPLAGVFIYDEAAMAAVYINTVWINCKPTDYFLNEKAFHEVIEVLTYNLERLIPKGKSLLAEEKRHEIINTLQNSIFESHHKEVKIEMVK